MIEWRKIYTFLWLGAALLCALSPAGAQLPGMRKYTQQDGFTATSGFEFEQDERGFLWIGTDNGGMSFDGKKFRVLLDKDDFPDAEILAIRPLSYDRVLLIPISHSLCYLDKGKLVTEKEDPRLSATHNPNHNVTRRDPATQSFWLSDGRLLTKLFRFSGNAIEEHNVGNTRFTKRDRQLLYRGTDRHPEKSDLCLHLQHGQRRLLLLLRRSRQAIITQSELYECR
jgi:hypothetical protein